MTVPSRPAISERTRSGAVAERLRREILDGYLVPGSKLRQVEVAQRFGVSTTPVREAFATLAQEGLVVKDSHRGVMVFRPSGQELREIYEIRLALEPLAVELASPRMADVDLDVLDDIIARMRLTTDPIRRHELNADLHALIYAHAGRPRLTAMIEHLRSAAAAYLRFLSRSRAGPGLHDTIDDEHQAIVDALRRRDSGAAAVAMRQHLASSQEHIEAAIAEPRA